MIMAAIASKILSQMLSNVNQIGKQSKNGSTSRIASALSQIQKDQESDTLTSTGTVL